MAAGWTDQHGGLRACRARLRERYPVLTSSTLASALGFHPTWYSRVESGKAGLTVTNFARVAGGVLGLLAATYPNDVWTLHDLIRDVPRPDPLPQLPSLPTERKSPGSIPTLLKLYTYFSRHLNRPLLLDEILAIARYIPTALTPLLDEQHLSVAAGT